MSTGVATSARAPVYHPVAGVNVRALPLLPEQAFVLSRVDGHNDAAAIAQVTGLPLPDVLAHLMRLEELGAVSSPGSAPVAPRSARRPSSPPRTPAPAFGSDAPTRPPPPGALSGAPTKPPPAAAPSGPRHPDIDESLNLSVEVQARILDLSERLADLNHFELLGVERSADRAAIKRAYFSMIGTFHPDKHFGKKLGSFTKRMEKIFQRMTEAHDVLSNPRSREEYEAYLGAVVVTRGVETGSEAPPSMEDLERLLEQAEQQARKSPAPASPPPVAATPVAPAPAAAVAPAATATTTKSGVRAAPGPSSGTAAAKPAGFEPQKTISLGPPAHSPSHKPPGPSLKPPGPSLKPPSPSLKPPGPSLKPPGHSPSLKPPVYSPSLKPPGRAVSLKPGAPPPLPQPPRIPPPLPGGLGPAAGARRPPSERPVQLVDDPAARRQALARKLGLAPAPAPPPGAAEERTRAEAARQSAVAKELHQRYEHRKTAIQDQRLQRFIQVAEEAVAAGNAVSAMNSLRIARGLINGDSAAEARIDELERHLGGTISETYLQKARYEESNAQYAEAARSYTRAARGSPSPDVLRSAAECYLKAGTELRLAGELAREAVQMAPDRTDLRLSLAKIYEAAGMPQSAVRELERALTLTPGSDKIKQWLKRLERAGV